MWRRANKLRHGHDDVDVVHVVMPTLSNSYSLLLLMLMMKTHDTTLQFQ